MIRANAPHIEKHRLTFRKPGLDLSAEAAREVQMAKAGAEPTLHPGRTPRHRDGPEEACLRVYADDGDTLAPKNLAAERG